MSQSRSLIGPVGSSDALAREAALCMRTNYGIRAVTLADSHTGSHPAPFGRTLL